MGIKIILPIWVFAVMIVLFVVSIVIMVVVIAFRLDYAYNLIALAAWALAYGSVIIVGKRKDEAFA
jgi:hypothetical protein